jgi:DNA polymerase-3 subunit epsilon
MRHARRTSWRDARFIVVDLETTGLDPRRDEIVSFAAIPVDAACIVPGESVQGLVRPESPPPAPSIAIHGLRPVDLAAAAPAAEALAPLAAAMEGRTLVAHAAWVERDFLEPQLRALGSALSRHMVDTALLWRLLCVERDQADPGWCSLSAIAAALGLPCHRPHEADGDALTTAQAFLALATHLESRGHGSVRALAGAATRLRARRVWQPPDAPAS